MKQNQKVKTFNKGEFEKMTTNLSNMQKAQKITARFLINYFTQSCVENGLDNPTYCNYFFKAQGHKIFSQLLEKFKDNEQITYQMLAVLDSTLKNLDENSLAVDLIESNLLHTLFDFIESQQYKPYQELSLNILVRLSGYLLVHQLLIQKNVLDFLVKLINHYIELKSDKLEDTQMIAQVFFIVKNLVRNEKILEILIQKKVLSSLFKLYEIYESYGHYKKLLIDVLQQMSINQNAKVLIKETQINLKKLLLQSYQRMNLEEINVCEQIILNLTEEDKVIDIIKKVKSSEINEENMIYFGTLSAHETYLYLMEDQELIKSLSQTFITLSSDQLINLSIIKYFSQLIKLNSSYIQIFYQNGVVEKIVKDLKDEIKDTHFLISEFVQFFTVILNHKSELSTKIIIENELGKVFINLFTSLKEDYHQYKSQAITLDKARNSLLYHEGKISQKILEVTTNFQQANLLPKQIALEYISSTYLTQMLFSFIGMIGQNQEGSESLLNKEFFETILLVMRVFKYDQHIHEEICKCLSSFNYQYQQGKLIVDLDYFFMLSDRIWINPDWNLVGYYCLKFIEKLSNNNEIIPLLKNKLQTIKLVASISNFVNEQDKKKLEFTLEQREQDWEHVNRNHSVLSFGQEREIKRLSRVITNKLMDQGLQEDFQKSITKLIDNFKANKETITILRSELAVIAEINGIGFYGQQGLKNNLDKWLLKVNDTIENWADFDQKESLLADNLLALANFIGVSDNEAGSNLYQQKQISENVLNLFLHHFKRSNQPLKTYVMLQALKEWLIQRIEIIENFNNIERIKIYDPDSFMLVNKQNQENLLTSVQDVLFENHQKFEKNQMIVGLNFEIIILLGYVYPEWKSKIGKNFIPLILESLKREHLDLETDKQAIELLNHICGVDGKDQVKDDLLALIAKKDGIKIITKSISDNNFDSDYIALCEPLLKNIGKKEENLTQCYPDIDELLKKLDDFNKLSNSEKIQNLNTINKDVDQLNAYTIVESLRNYAFDNDHTDKLHLIWDFINEINKDQSQLGEDYNNINLIDKLEKGQIIGMAQHLESPTDIDEKIQLYGNLSSQKDSKGNLLLNALRALEKYKKNPLLVQMNAKIVNEAFPDFQDEVKNLAKVLNFQPTLEYLFNQYSKDEDQNLAQEIVNLYMNLSESQNDLMIEKILKKNFQKLNQAINASDEKEVNYCWNQIKPYVKHEVFQNKFQEFSVDDHILNTLDFLNKKTNEKTNQDLNHFVNQVLGSTSNPDLGEHNRKILKDEITLAKNITDLMLNLQPNQKDIIRQNKELVGKSDIAGILNGSPQTFELYENFLQEPENIKILGKNNTLECGTYLLMKNNQDSFKKEQLQNGSQLQVSTLQPIKQSVQPSQLTTSQIGIQKAQNNIEQIINENIDKFGKMIENLLDKEKSEQILSKYIKDMNSYKSHDQQALQDLLNSSRMVSAILCANPEKLQILENDNSLKSAFDNLLSNLEGEKIPNKKLLQFFENNFNKIGSILQDSKNNFESQKFWNQLVHRYLVQSPGFIKTNAKTIFENLELTRPKQSLQVFQNEFYENTSEIKFTPFNNENGNFNSQNIDKLEEIILNYYRSILTNDIPEQIALSNLECFSRSNKFCEKFLLSSKFNDFLTRFKDSNMLEEPIFFNRNTEILLNIVNAITLMTQSGNQNLSNHFHQHFQEALIMPFIQNIEEQRDGFMDHSLLFLNTFFEIQKNKQIYSHRGFHLALYNNLKKNTKGNEQMMVLLCKLSNDPIIKNQLSESNFFEEIYKKITYQLFNENPLIKNPSEFSNFKTQTPLYEDKQQLLLSLQVFLFGELSFIQKYIQQLNENNNYKNGLELYMEFRKFEHIPILAVKLLESSRNSIMNMNIEFLENHENIINDLIIELPIKIEKFQNFNKTQSLLQDIYDFLKNYQSNKKPKSLVDMYIDKIVQNQLPDDQTKVRDLNQIAQLYSDLVDELQDHPLNQNKEKLLNALNQEVDDLLLIPNSQVPSTLMNLLTPHKLRLIVNNHNSSLNMRIESIQLLNNFAKQQEVMQQMLENDFFTNKSQELINYFLSPLKQDQKIQDEYFDLVKYDMEFLRKLTLSQKGTSLVMCKTVDEIPLIKNLFKFLLGPTAVDVKLVAVQILKQLLKHSENKDLENLVIQNLLNLIEVNKKSFQISAELIMLADVFASKGDKYINELIKVDILKADKEVLTLFKGSGNLIETASSHLMYKIANEHPNNHDYVMKSGALQTLSNSFSKSSSPKELHENIAKLMLQLSFQNQDRKLQLINDNFLMGLVPLLNYYSSKQFFDENMISLVLKCMANFSLVEQGVDSLLKNDVIKSFKEFFKNYREDYDDQNNLVLCTVANLSYEPKNQHIERIIKDKGIEFILDALQYYSEKEKVNICEPAIDSLTHMSTLESSLNYISTEQQQATDILVDILRQQLDSKLVYKSLRCLTKFSEFEPLSKRFIDKGGPSNTVSLFSTYQKDLKNIFQALKLISTLIRKHPENFEEFLFAGIPEKIIINFDSDWPVEIIKKIIEIFARLAANNENVKDILAQSFLDTLVNLMKIYFKNKNLIRNGIVLLAVCSNSITSVQTIFSCQGNHMANDILQAYITSENILMNNLVLMENMLLMSNDSKEQYLQLKSDEIVEKIYKTTHPVEQKEIHNQAKKVLDLLRDNVATALQNSHLAEEQKSKYEDIKGEDEKNESTAANLEQQIPKNIQVFLNQGRILRVYGEDGVCRSMHFFVSKDFLFIKCKHPKDSFIKQKWIMPIHKIKQIVYKYNKDSPIAKSANFFRKAPTKEKCFAVFGPQLFKGPQNFHLLCESSFEAKKWYEYLTFLKETFEKLRSRRLSGYLN